MAKTFSELDRDVQDAVMEQVEKITLVGHHFSISGMEPAFIVKSEMTIPPSDENRAPIYISGWLAMDGAGHAQFFEHSTDAIDKAFEFAETAMPTVDLTAIQHQAEQDAWTANRAAAAERGEIHALTALAEEGDADAAEKVKTHHAENERKLAASRA